MSKVYRTKQNVKSLQDKTKCQKFTCVTFANYNIIATSTNVRCIPLTLFDLSLAAALLTKKRFPFEYCYCS